MIRHTIILWGVAKSRLPHHMHSTHTHTLPIGSVGDPARQMSGTRRQAPTRVSTPTQMVAAGGAGSEALLCQGSGPQGGGGVGKV